MDKKQLKISQFFQNFIETIRKAKVLDSDGDTYEKNDALFVYKKTFLFNKKIIIWKY